MVAARPTPGKGIPVGMIVFLVLFVIATILAVVFYLGKEDTQQKLVEVEDTLDQFVATFEKTQANAALKQAKQQKISLYKYLSDEARQLAQLASGQSDASAAAIRQARNSLVNRIKQRGVPVPRQIEGNLFAALQAMDQWYRQESTKVAKLQEAIAAKETQLDQALRQAQTVKTEMDKQIANLQKRITALGATLKTYDEKAKGKIKEITQQRLSGESQAARREKRLQKQLKAKETSLVKTRQRIRELLVQLEKFRPGFESGQRQSDGQVVKVLADENTVYVDLGRKRGDRLNEGMSFEVYSQRTGIPQTGEGKAAVEVVRIGDYSTQCRILRQTPGDPIISGDLVANVVYDRDRKYKFVVFGEFDLQGKGASVPGDTDRVKQMIQQWGGQVARQLDPTIDFVVLGIAPPEPRMPDDTTDPLKLAVYRRKKAKRDNYLQVLAEAKDLSIPILNQNRFLHFIGFATQAKRF